MSKKNVLEKKDKNIFEIIISIILILMIIVLSSLIAVGFITPKDSGKLLFNIDDKVFATVEVGGKERFVMPNPEAKDGYSFEGWYFDKDTLSDPCTEKTIKDKKINGATNVFAKWIKNEYTITYNIDGGVEVTANPSGYAVDTATITLAAPTKLGYTFSGWYGKADFKDKAITEIAIGSTGNKELFAKWTKNDYTIIYNLDGGENAKTNPSGYAVDTATITLNAPTKLGYTFAGWFEDDKFTKAITEIAKGSTGNKTLFAKWTAIEYGITYNLDGGTNSLDNPSKYTIENAITLAAPTKVGYTFDGWYSEDTFKTVVTEIAKGTTSDKTLFAKWNINTYTIRYDTNGGVTMADTPYTVLTMPSPIAAPTKTGYDFAAWYDNSTLSGSPITAITKDNIGNKTLYAKWTAIEYDIIYELNGGVQPTSYPKTYNIETGATLATPTKVGYTFSGWCTDTGLVNGIATIAIGSTGTVNVYAKWTKDTYTITYVGVDGVGATNPNTTVSYGIDTPTITLLDATRNGYTFAGWFDAEVGGNRVLAIEKGSFDDKKLYAHWDIINYGITYDLDGGINNAANIDNYNIGTATITLANPTHIDRTDSFDGWYDAAIGGRRITAVAGGAIGDLTLYAHWTYTATAGLNYIDNGDILVVIETTTTSGDIVIPRRHNNKLVAMIAEYAFLSKTGITKVVLPSSITTIGASAFANCSSLASVNIPDSVTSIGDFAFFNAPLTKIFIPNSVTTMSANVFYGCSNITISCERASAPAYNPNTGTGWYSDAGEYWYGDVSTTKILWSQTRPKLVP